MKIEKTLEKTVTCKADPCEEKTQFIIVAPSFRDLEQANDAAGDIMPHELAIAKKQAENEAKQIELGTEPAPLPDDEQLALFRLSRWVRDRNTAIVLRCLKGADNLRFNDEREVEQFLLSLRPADAVRDVVDELATAIFEFDKDSKKNNS